MASQTAYFNLTKAASNENYDLSVVNSNLDRIDDQLHNNQVSAAKEMLGATALADGESGRIPVPDAGDEERVLTGAGIWVDAISVIDFAQLTAQQIADLKTALGLS